MEFDNTCYLSCKIRHKAPKRQQGREETNSKESATRKVILTIDLNDKNNNNNNDNTIRYKSLLQSYSSSSEENKLCAITKTNYRISK